MSPKNAAEAFHSALCAHFIRLPRSAGTVIAGFALACWLVKVWLDGSGHTTAASYEINFGETLKIASGWIANPSSASF
jgi:hypothetical protein